MPAAPDLNDLPPLPSIVSKGEEAVKAEATILSPIPELPKFDGAINKAQQKALPKVAPPQHSKSKELIRRRPLIQSRRAAVRKIDSPFESTIDANDLPIPEERHKTAPLPEPDEISPSLANKAPETAGIKMTPPAQPIPSLPEKPPIRKRPVSSITGPVSTQRSPAPIVPPDVMLRHTVRRTIAEQDAAASPFQEVPPWERLKWMARALFTSRSYDDIAFEKTRRFRVVEVFLLRKDSYTLISYASSDPLRHVYPSKIDYDLRRLRLEVKEAINSELDSFKLPAGKRAVIRSAKSSFLVAVCRGESNEFFETDLDFIHKRIEHQVGKRLTDEVSNFTFPLQPALEDCLLIQSPAGPK